MIIGVIIVFSLSSSCWLFVIAASNLTHSFCIAAEFSLSEAVALILAIPWSLQLLFDNYFF